MKGLSIVCRTRGGTMGPDVDISERGSGECCHQTVARLPDPWSQQQTVYTSHQQYCRKDERRCE